MADNTDFPAINNINIAILEQGSSADFVGYVWNSKHGTGYGTAKRQKEGLSAGLLAYKHHHQHKNADDRRPQVNRRLLPEICRPDYLFQLIIHASYP